MSDDQDYIDPNWRGKYPSLKAFYDANYPSQYYEFEPLEYEIDPMETKEEVEAYDEARQLLEYERCYASFDYFCHKYVKITHPKKGLLPFITYKYQRSVIKQYNDHRFSIISKFRQGGLTTVTVNWAMWRCLFRLDETIMVVSKTDREAIAAGEIVKRALEELPSWMQPVMEKNNDRQKIFNESGCKLFFYSPEAARGRSLTYLIIDEAAFIQNMDKLWNGVFPTLAGGGNCVVISTVNGIGNWYERTYHAAQAKENKFNVIDLDYLEHPEYNNPEWVRQMRAQLGEKGWQQEVLRDFLGAAESFIPADIINDIELEARKNDPAKIMFEEWANVETRIRRSEIGKQRGALHIWREPIPGREYIMGVDAATGSGGLSDNSCFEIIDAMTCEQVAEFYSNLCPTHIFTQIVYSVATLYNKALVVVEAEKCGLTVLERLQHDMAYENLYFTDGVKPGINTSKTTRPMFMEILQTRMLTKTMIVRSVRFIEELKHLSENPVTKKVETSKGYHDDAIMASCFALFVREQQGRNGPDVTLETKIEERTERYKQEIFEKIKAELDRGISGDWFDEEEEFNNGLDVKYDEATIALSNRIKRPFDRIYREFGW